MSETCSKTKDSPRLTHLKLPRKRRNKRLRRGVNSPFNSWGLIIPLSTPAGAGAGVRTPRPRVKTRFAELPAGRLGNVTRGGVFPTGDLGGITNPSCHQKEDTEADSTAGPGRAASPGAGVCAEGKGGPEATRTASQLPRAQLWGSEVGPVRTRGSHPAASPFLSPSHAPQAPPPPLHGTSEKG